MKDFKNILRITAAAFLLLTMGCEGKLEEVVPQTALNEKLIKEDPNAARALHYGTYSHFRRYTNTLMQLGEIRSEIWADGVFPETADATMANLYTHNIDVDNVPVGNFGAFYGSIYVLNNELRLISQSNLPETERNKFMAEAYGLRAFVYYTLLKTWGGVPLTTEVVSGLDDLGSLYKERSAPEVIMQQIKADIEQSLSLFSGSNALPTKRVMWNRLATLALKGDVYLWSATLMNGGDADLNTAKQALEQLVALEGTNFGLNASYADSFDATKKENNKEIIFAINYEQNQVVNNVFNGHFLINVAMTSDRLDNGTGPTVASTYPLAVGQNRIGMSVAMLQKLRSNTSDRRIAASFRPFFLSGASSHKGVILLKYIGREVSGLRVYDNDFPIYRYADVLLMLAEAKAKLLQSPATEINKIRQRAYGAGYTPYVNGTQDQNIEAILEEQLREFIGEGKRWWALRRAGDKWVFKYIEPRFLTEATKYKFLLPITRAQLESDPKLTQTPGYIR
ncbi:RagB/SusD family nutrient uptake outer membrane protein [Pedobacter sp.]